MKKYKGQVKDKINEGITELVNLECYVEKELATQIIKAEEINISVNVGWRVETEILDKVRDHLRSYFERTLNHKVNR